MGNVRMQERGRVRRPSKGGDEGDEGRMEMGSVGSDGNSLKYEERSEKSVI
jgi:hypothetical protein